MIIELSKSIFLLACLSLNWPSPFLVADPPTKVTIQWDNVVAVSKTTATIQVEVTPLLRPGSPVYGAAIEALRNLQADYVRYIPWFPHPHLAVMELEPPRDGKTSWDFSQIDPTTVGVLKAISGRPLVMNFSTIPEWMFKTKKPTVYPQDPGKVDWEYEQGTELRDPSLKELSEYFTRIVSWYTRGGFTDEYGKWHGSGHKFLIDYWEVLNEPDLEHEFNPEQYTAIYDAVVAAVLKVDPRMKFVGLALAYPSRAPRYFEYFLNPKNHKPGTPLDMISYHFYAVPTPDESTDAYQFTFFDQAETFLATVRYIESIRKRLAPKTRTSIDELGAISPVDFDQKKPGYTFKPLAKNWWNLSAALYAYIYGQLSRLGIDVVGASALLQYPTRDASTSMMDWNTGQPNARYWTLKMLRDNFAPGDKLVDTKIAGLSVYAQAFLTPHGKRKVLLVNKRDRPIEISVPGEIGHPIELVDQNSGSNPPVSFQMDSENFTLPGLAVGVMDLSK